MKYSTYRFSLDLHRHQSQMSIAVFQYDTACRLYISLTDGGIPYLIEDGCRAVFYARRPDNTPLSHNCMIEGNSRIVYDFLDSTAAKQGIVDCQIRLYGKEGDLITAPRFIIVVEERAVREYEIELEDDTLSAIDQIFLTENERVEAEQERVQAESERITAEQERMTAENARLEAERLRVSAESVRVTTEEERDNAEAERQAAERSRVDAERSRVDADLARGDEETSRNINETKRENQENGRVTSETARVEAEQERVQAEIARVNAEKERVSADKSREERTSAAIANLSQVYRLGGVVNTLGDLPSDPTIGIVYSVESDFTLNGRKYNAGTNVVYTENGWDALGGMYDLALVSQWDFIITDSDITVDGSLDASALMGMLTEVTGRVLVKISGVLNVSGEFKIPSGVELIDFAGLPLASSGRVTFKGEEKDTVIRNLYVDRCIIKGFKSAENIHGIPMKFEECDEVRSCHISSATNCGHILNCVAYPEYSERAIFTNCSLISNLTISSIESIPPEVDYGVEFNNCHHISNVHCADGVDEAVDIHYKNCTFVDPYTCAGYVSSENSGKVPVPDDKGGVEFKEFVPRLKANKMLAVYVEDPKNGLRLATASPSASAGYFVYRTNNGQLNAPDQEACPPSDDQYVSKRYVDKHFAPKLYRHEITIHAHSDGDDWSTIVRFTIYSYRSSPYEECDEIKGVWLCSGEQRDYMTEPTAILHEVSVSASVFFVEGVGLSESTYFYKSISVTNQNGYSVTINDNVTEVI